VKGHACHEKAKRQRHFKSKRSPPQEKERSDRGLWQVKGHACHEKAKRHIGARSPGSPIWKFHTGGGWTSANTTTLFVLECSRSGVQLCVCAASLVYCHAGALLLFKWATCLAEKQDL